MSVRLLKTKTLPTNAEEVVQRINRPLGLLFGRLTVTVLSERESEFNSFLSLHSLDAKLVSVCGTQPQAGSLASKIQKKLRREFIQRRNAGKLVSASSAEDYAATHCPVAPHTRSWSVQGFLPSLHELATSELVICANDVEASVPYGRSTLARKNPVVWQRCECTLPYRSAERDICTCKGSRLRKPCKSKAKQARLQDCPECGGEVVSLVPHAKLSPERNCSYCNGTGEVPSLPM
jgi:hypothetical protein